MNEIHIIGNLTRDPEMRKSNGDVEVCNFCVAVNNRRKGTTEQTDATFFDVSAWRELGKLCQQYLKKGRKVSVTGPVSLNTWTKPNGDTGASIRVTAHDVEFLSSPERGTNSYAAPAQAQTEPTQAASDEDGELPF